MKSRIEKAGIKVPRKADGAVDCTIEIAPSFAFCVEDVIAKKDQIFAIQPGDEIYFE